MCMSLHLEVFIHGPMLAPAVSQVRPMSTFLGRRLITFVRPRCSLMEGRVGAAGGEGWEKGGGQGSPHLGLQGGANLSSLIRFFKSHSATLSATLFRMCTIFSTVISSLPELRFISDIWSRHVEACTTHLVSVCDPFLRPPVCV